MSFAIVKQLNPGDVVVVPKSELNVIAHYLIYIGRNSYGEAIYAENIQGYGVRLITESQFVRENPKYKRIRRMNTTEYERSLAVERAKSLVGKAYDLTNFNCEHYANYVQYNTSFSKQVSNTLNAAIGIGIGIALLAAFAGGSKGKAGRS